MPDTPTVTQRLADLVLGGEGEAERFVRERRARRRSWRLIARDFHEATDLDLTYETLRAWFPDGAVEPEPTEAAS